MSEIAREVKLICDVCRKETDVIVGKLHFIPMISGVARAAHSNYSHHLDVGMCCKDKLLNTFNFKQRMTAAEYRRLRRRGVVV